MRPLHLEPTLARVPLMARPATFAAGLLPGLVVLVLGSTLGWFKLRVTAAPPTSALPSPWSVATAAAQDDGACQLTVRVREAANNGRPVHGALLTFVRLVEGTPAETLVARTHADGTYRAIDLPRGLWNVTIVVDGHALQGVPEFRCARSGQRASFDLPVSFSDHVVVGRVVDEGRRPLRGAEVALWQDARHRTGLAGVVRINTDEDGRFRARLPPGEYVTWTNARDHKAQRGTLHVHGETTTWATKLAFQPMARGQVVDDQEHPQPYAVVFVGGAWDPTSRTVQVVADEEGRFAMPVALGQVLELGARAANRVGSRQVGLVDDVSDVQALRIVVTAGRRVIGEVQTNTGHPYPHGRVSFRVRALGLVGEVVCDENGRFAVEGLPSDDVEFWATDSALAAWGARVADASMSEVLLPFVPPPY